MGMFVRLVRVDEVGGAGRRRWCICVCCDKAKRREEIGAGGMKVAFFNLDIPECGFLCIINIFVREGYES